MRPLSVPRGHGGSLPALCAPAQLAGLALELAAVARPALGRERERAVRGARPHLAGRVERVLGAVLGTRVRAGRREAVVLVHTRTEDVRVRLRAAAVVAVDGVVDPHALDALAVATQL